MPMSDVLHNLLKEKLADVKVKLNDGEVAGLSLKPDTTGAVGLLDFAVSLYDKYEAVTPIQSANKELADKKRELTAQLDAKEKELAKIAKDAADAKTQLESVIGEKLSDADKKAFLELKQRGMTAEQEAKFNAVFEEAKALKAEKDAWTSEKQQLSERVTQVTLGTAKEALKSKFLVEAAKYGISGERASVAYMMVENKGMIRVEKQADGSFKEIYRKRTPDGRELESQFDTIVKDFATAEENAFLRSGSTSGGTGQEHKGSQGGGGGMTYRQMISKKE